jgi:hypothetical protein
MRIIKAIVIGIFIWILASSFYTASYYLPFLENLEMQANLVLAIAIIPNAWLGARVFYSTGSRMHGFSLASIILFIAIALDVMITVPFIIVPQGGSYRKFFGAPAFWLIALEYFLVVFSYWRFKVKPRLSNV